MNKNTIGSIIGEYALADDKVQMTALTDIILAQLTEIPQKDWTENHIRKVIETEVMVWEANKNGLNQSLRFSN